MKETTKSMRRRWKENATGFFPWGNVFWGNGLDVGAGDDPLKITNVHVKPFDQADGDANILDSYFEEDTFDFVHGSNVLEHLHDPFKSVGQWLKITKKGGHVVLTVPEMSLYGDILWGKTGSRYNQDHKATFSMGLRRSGAPMHVYVPDFVKAIEEKFNATCLRASVADTNYDFTVGFTRDQTYDLAEGVEAWCEMVFLKK